jgi:hypothetical protein
MRIMTAALGAALVLCDLGMFSAAAQARKAKGVREPRPIIRVPMVRTDWVDPYGQPVMPVLRYGRQEVYLPPWTWPEIYLPPLIPPR